MIDARAAVEQVRRAVVPALAMMAIVVISGAGASTAVAAPTVVASAHQGAVKAATPAPSPSPGTKGTAAAKVKPNTFGIAPSSRVGPDRRPIFNYAATPGASLRDHVAVINYSKQPLRLSLYPTDSVPTNDGTFALKTRAQKPTDVGSWITLRSPRQIVVPARTSKGLGIRVVPFTVKVPSGANPGDQAGGIVTSLTTRAKDKDQANVALDQRIASRVYVRVAGELDAALDITDIGAAYGGTWNPVGRGTATVNYTVKNTGNVQLAFVPNVTVSALVGAWTAPALKPQVLLPGSSVTLTSVVEGVLPELLDKATVRIDPKAQGAGSGFDVAEVSASTRFWAIPWLLIALVVALVAAWYLRHRSAKAMPPDQGLSSAPAEIGAASGAES